MLSIHLQGIRRALRELAGDHITRVLVITKCFFLLLSDEYSMLVDYEGDGKSIYRYETVNWRVSCPPCPLDWPP
jgi:hypothetical protein